MSQIPYKSDAQRRFMHAKHPEIAARWDEEIRAQRKKKGKLTKVEKAAQPGYLKPLLIGITGGALANQIPQNQHPSKLGELHVKPKKKKAKIQKAVYEDWVHSEDPDFNHEAARKAFDLVMKMDLDSAEMFTLMAIGEIYETDVEKNLRTLQHHLDWVIDKRLEITKRAMLRTVAKGRHEGAQEAASAVDLIEKAVVNPYTSGRYQFEESDFRRDPNTGRFQTKIKHTQKKPLSNRVADSMGLAPIDGAARRRYIKLSDAQKAQYQDEYRQLASFLDTVTQSTADGGDRNIFLRLEDSHGNEFRQQHVGSAHDADSTLLNTNLKLLAVEASPNTLTVGGSAFGLAQALGAPYGPRTAQTVGMGDRAVSGLPTFAETWTKSPEDMKFDNERLYNRVGAAGAYVGAVAPPGSKAAMAAKLAEVVGSHGPEAERVIGPSARKTAYRYRGTEKKPDRHIVTLYERAISRTKRVGVSPEEPELRTPRAGGRPGPETAARKPTRVKPGAKAPVVPAVSQMAASESEAANRPPTWEERSEGRRVIQDQLRATLPKGDLYTLQASSGNLPPSEGILLNADGQIVTQAVGYGDDHYLPFNLKNLKALKGGEYIRTRSVGGLTSEDIYTGLSSGARRVTVVSRSGTFSVEFQPDFRGGRRYNDKALRMTRRYEQLLDAVQSNKVSRGPVPPQVEQAIRTEVADELRGESRAAVNTEVTRRLNEYREDPGFGPEDQKILNLVYEQGLRDNPSRDAMEWEKVARNLVMQGKNYNYQLDAKGYEAAQDALAEQFPYYIRSIPVIEKEGQLVSGEKDKGYVEPGRGRPTAVLSGLYGTRENQPGNKEVGSQKFSASQSNFQRGRIGAGPADTTTPGQKKAREAQAAARAQEEKEETTGAAPKLSRAQAAIRQGQAADAAVELMDELRKQPNFADLAAGAPILREDPTDFAVSVNDPVKMERFRDTVERMIAPNLAAISERAPELHSAYLKFKRQSGAAGAIGYEDRYAFQWTPQPMEFGAVGYRRGDSEAEREHERKKIDARTKSLVTGKPLSTLTEGELRAELAARRHIHTAVTQDPVLREVASTDDRKQLAIDLLGSDYDPEAIRLMVGPPEHMIAQARDVHRMRALQQGVPDTMRGSQTATRDNAPPNPLGQTWSNLTKRRAVEERVQQLKALRAQDTDDDTVEHPVDPQVADGELILSLLAGNGDVPDSDIQNFLDDSADFASVSALGPKERALFEGLSDLGKKTNFRQDAQGIWHRR